MSLRMSSLDPGEPRATKGMVTYSRNCLIVEIPGIDPNRLPDLQQTENQVRQEPCDVQKVRPQRVVVSRLWPSYSMGPRSGQPRETKWESPPHPRAGARQLSYRWQTGDLYCQRPGSFECNLFGTGCTPKNPPTRPWRAPD